MDGDSVLKDAQKDRVVNMLLPFVAAWRLASQSHHMGRMLCKDCM